MTETFRLTRDYPLLGLKAGDLCRYGDRGELLEVYRTQPIRPDLVADLKAGAPLRRPATSTAARRGRRRALPA